MGKIVDLVQGSPKWLSWRKDGKIGSSDASAIMGVSKFVTPWQLYMRKLGLIPEQTDNAAMESGRARESIALAAFNEKYGCKCVPVVMQHEEYPWMIASLDGWDEDKKIAVEIKCPGKEDHEIAQTFYTPPPHYKPQLQHQLCVMDIPTMYYWSYKNGDEISIGVARDDAYIADMLVREQEFMLRMKLLDPPPLTEKDYVENNSREWRYAAENYILEKENLEIAQRRYEEARVELIRLSEDHNCRGSGVQLTKVVRRGAVDYSSIPELEDIDLDKYRKDPITSWRVTEQ
jgi:putative phage-type endonuclease